MRRRSRIICFGLMLILIMLVPMTSIAETVVYYENFIHIERSQYVKANSVSLDRKVLGTESTQLASGIKETKEIAIEGSNKQHIDYTCEIDMNDENVEFLLGYVPSSVDHSKNMLATVSEQVEYAENTTGKNVVAAFNGSFYEMDTAESNGLLISNGKILHEARFIDRYDRHMYENIFAITDEGEAVILDARDLCYDIDTDTYTPIKDGAYRFAISGNAIILKNGTIPDEATVFFTDIEGDTRGSAHPRTAIGIKDDGSVVLFSTYGRIDPYNYGYTNQQVAMIMREKGCHTALMLDGGGSSTYLSQYPGEEKELLRNHISDITQRSVCSGILIASTEIRSDDSDELSLCEKNGHDYQYKNKEVTCSRCDFKSGIMEFSGLVKDIATGKYRMFINGKTKTGWAPYGTDHVYYFDKQGLSCKVTVKEDVPTKCTKKGYKLVNCTTAPEGNRQYKLNYESAPGHDYDKNRTCANCGMKLVSVNDCTIKLSDKKLEYTGSTRTPNITLVTPSGKKLTKNAGDFNITVKNNKSIGTATIGIEPIEYSNNYMEDRGSITGRKTITYEIVPKAASNLRSVRTGYNSVDLKWTASKTASKKYKITYEIYKKTTNGWKKVGSTQKTSYTIKNLKKGTSYSLRVTATAKGSDGKKYTSATYAVKTIKTKGLTAPVIKASNVKKTGKIKLTWKKIKGAEKYRVYRAKSSKGKYYFMKTIKGTSYINKTSVKGKTYWYKVKAIDTDNTANNSVFSNVVKRKGK